MNRLSVVETTYHEAHGAEGPIAFQTKFNRELSSTDQACLRASTAGPDWKELDTYWVANPGCIHIRNDLNHRVPGFDLLVGALIGDAVVPVFFLPPGDSLRCSPFMGLKLHVRALTGEVPYSMFAVPE